MIAVHDIYDGTSVISSIVTGSDERFVGVKVHLDRGFPYRPVAQVGAPGGCEADDNDGHQSSDFDDCQNIVENDTTMAPGTVNEASTGQCCNGYATNGLWTVRSASGSHDVLAHCDGIAGQVAKDNKYYSIQARCPESRILVYVLQLPEISGCTRSALEATCIVLLSTITRDILKRTVAIDASGTLFLGLELRYG